MSRTRTLPARLSNRAENSEPRTICNRVAYQAHVEIQLELEPSKYQLDFYIGIQKFRVVRFWKMSLKAAFI